jgi:hypothetical protein
MSLILNGTDGLSDVDGTAGTPAIRGTDANTGIFFPAADTIAFSEGGTEAMRIDSSGNVGIGTTSPSVKMEIRSAVNSPQLVLTGTASRGLRISTSNPDGQNDATVIYNAQDTEAPGYGQHIWQSGGTERMRLTPAGLLQFNSGYGSVATAYGCRAWVNFNGTGTPAIRASGNVSSITDGGTGNFTVNFSSAMPDVNYSTVGFCGGSTGEVFAAIGASTYSTSAVQVRARTVLDASQDPAIYCVAVFR